MTEYKVGQKVRVTAEGTITSVDEFGMHLEFPSEYHNGAYFAFPCTIIYKKGYTVEVLENVPEPEPPVGTVYRFDAPSGSKGWFVRTEEVRSGGNWSWVEDGRDLVLQGFSWHYVRTNPNVKR